MKPAVLFHLIATLAFLSPISAFAQVRGMGPQAATTLTWHTDAETAFAESRETGRPILAVFRCES